MKKQHYRTIWISDIHLGHEASRPDRLLAFLKSASCRNLYLVGDIFDIWQMRRVWRWRPECNEVVRKILKISRVSRVVYVPGNHDAEAREYCGHTLGNVEIAETAEHTCPDGRRFLVTHGDQFDIVVQNHWLVHIGGFFYDRLIIANMWLNWLRRRLRLRPWSLSGYVKRNTKRACMFVSNYEEALAKEARDKGYDGVVCGHIHQAEVREKDGFTYCNSGDWVENCCALVEHDDGTLEVLRFGDE